MECVYVVILTIVNKGSGKTSGVYKRHAGDQVFCLALSNGTTTWWDGYRGQPVILIDEFEGEGISWATLKQITDPWFNATVPVKGGFVALTADTIYISSNKEPELWYPKVGETAWKEMNRRISEWVDFGREEHMKPRLAAAALRKWTTPEKLGWEKATVLVE